MAARSDTFNRGDVSSPPGTPSDGGPDWVQLAATAGISSNQWAAATTGLTVAYLDSSTSAVEVSAKVGTPGAVMSIVARILNTSGYLQFRYTGSSLQLQHRISGSNTNIGSAYTVTLVPGDVLKLRCDASDGISGYLNGTLVCGPVTDATNNTATKHGLLAQTASTIRWDDFSIADISGSPAVLPWGVGDDGPSLGWFEG